MYSLPNQAGGQHEYEKYKCPICSSERSQHPLHRICTQEDNPQATTINLVSLKEKHNLKMMENIIIKVTCGKGYILPCGQGSLSRGYCCIVAIKVVFVILVLIFLHLYSKERICSGH